MKQQNTTPARVLFIVAAVVEALLALPFISYATVVVLGFTPLLVAFALHVVALIFASRENMPTHAPIVGIVASVLGAVPIISWVSHALACVLYLVTLIGPKGPQPETDEQEIIEEKIHDAEIVEEPVTVPAK